MPSSTASTATIRAWAQAEGLEVGDRGRLRAEILGAYANAHGGAVRPTGARAKKVAPAKSAPSTTAARKSAATSAPRPAAKAVVLSELGPVHSSVQQVARVVDNKALADLQDAVAALTVRVARLEAAAAPFAKPKKFGRSGRRE